MSSTHYTSASQHEDIGVKHVASATTQPKQHPRTSVDHPTYVNSAILSTEFQDLEGRDRRLKQTIRILRLTSRIMSLALAAITLGPLVATLTKYFETRHVELDLNGQTRTIWAHDTIAWYTYMYFGVALASFIVDLITVLAYCRGVQQANYSAKIASGLSTTILVAHIVVWTASAGIYRYGKEPANGKFRDLWGWTCSTAAKELQVVVTTINYDRYCQIQSTSFHSGIANAVLGFLSGLTYMFALLRLRSRNRLRAKSDEATELLKPTNIDGHDQSRPGPTQRLRGSSRPTSRE